MDIIKRNWRRLLGLLLIVVSAYWAINNISALQSVLSGILSVFIPFIIGGSLAYILTLPINFIEEKGEEWLGGRKPWFRPLSILLSFLLVIAVFLAIIFLILPDLQQTISSFIRVVPGTVTTIINSITGYLDNHPEVVNYIQELDIDINSIQQQLINYAQSFASGLLNSTVSIISTTVSSVINVFIAIIFAIYILMKKETIVRQVKKLVYGFSSLKVGNYLVNVGRKANDIFSSFIGGQIIEAIILGVLVYIGMLLFNFPYPLSVSVLTGAFALIPVYGAILGGVVGFILISVVSFSKALWFIVFIVVIQQIEGNIIYPRVVGSSLGLPGIWVMMTVTVGGALFGLTGMLVSVPIVSLIYSLLQAQVNYNLEKKNLDVATGSHDLG